RVEEDDEVDVGGDSVPAGVPRASRVAALLRRHDACVPFLGARRGRIGRRVVDDDHLVGGGRLRRERVEHAWQRAFRVARRNDDAVPRVQQRGSDATTVPVPSPFECTISAPTTSPLIVDPDFELESVSSTATYSGRSPGAGSDWPGEAVQREWQPKLPPPAKPLKLAGAEPPPSTLRFAHCEP